MDVNSFSCECSFWHLIISNDLTFDCLLLRLLIAKIAGFESMKRTALSSLSQMQFSCCAFLIASTSPILAHGCIIREVFPRNN